MSSFRCLVLLFFIVQSHYFTQVAAQSEGKKSTEYVKVLSSSEKQIILSCDFSNAFRLTDTIITDRQYAYFSGCFTSCRIPGEPWLPQEFVPFGVPEGSTAEIVLNDMQTEELHNVFLLPYPEVEGKLCTEPESFSRDVYSANRYFPESPVSISKQMQSRYLTFRNLSISPYIYNPVQRSIVFYKKFTVTITIKGGEFGKKVTSDAFTESLLTGTVINPKESRSFLVSPGINVNKAVSTQNWYQPGMDYYKMFIHQKGIYKIDYPAILAAGIQPLGKPLNKIAVYMGQSIIPVDIYDKNTNGIFDEDDFFVFAGTPPPPTPYCTQNIYQSANVYFITFNANDITGGRYNLVNSTVSVPGQIQSVYKRTDFYEIDQIFERLGHAGDDKRDFWFWGIADAMNNVPGRKFLVNFNPLTNLPTDSHLVSIQVKMHGMTNYNCGFDHHAVIKINGKKIGEAIWSGQTEYLYSGSFYVSSDSVQILPTGNIIEVIADGQTCRPEDGDEFRVNWFSFSYPSKQIAVNGKLTFDSPLNSIGIVRYETSGWSNDSVQVLCPQSHKKFTNLLFNAGTLTFTDSVISPSEYYGVAAGNYLSVDSIKKDISSELRNSANGADYLIIAHRQFTQIAERLKNIRSANFPDKLIPTPRISIIYVDDIYDEFSSGLQDPKAIQQFIAFTFSNWRSPAPAYAVLIGDMSSDYRQLLPTSRKNFIPSLDVMSFTYGIAASDNAFACIMGDDVLPDLALGRISIETVAEGNIVLDKLEHYPADTGKEWKNKGMMFASGMNEKDEADYGFNDESMMLKQNYLDAGGAFSKVIFRYPNKDIYQQYQGATEAMRNAISDGGVLLNYYGHGGGFQWDMVFSDDDIYVLNNQGRLPLVLSVTCYTGHFDNNDIFGEQFNKVEGKGSIGFFGSSGLTNWESGRYINNFVFDEIFTQKNYLTGKVFMKAKMRTPVNSWYGNQIALLTYLGDPVLKLALPDKPDFTITPSNIVLNSTSLQKGDSLKIQTVIKNYGLPSADSVILRIFADNGISTAEIYTEKAPCFAREKQINTIWAANLSGKVKIFATAATLQSIESDTTDNSASQIIEVANVDEPTPVWPPEALIQSSNTITFKMADFITGTGKTYNHHVQIDTAGSFLQPLAQSPAFSGINGVASWSFSGLANGTYFWRSRLTDSINNGKWSSTKIFTIAANAGFGISGKGLRNLQLNNVQIDSANNLLRFTAVQAAQGTITSGALGPAARWQLFNVHFKRRDPGIALKIVITGQNSITQIWDTVIIADTNTIPLLGISNKYKNLRFSISLSSGLAIGNLQAEIDEFAVSMTPLPEVRISADGIDFNNAKPLPGEALTGTVRVWNISPLIVDSVYITGQLEGGVISNISEAKAIQPDSSIAIPFSFPVPVSLKPEEMKSFTFRVNLPSEDIYSFNNSYTYPLAPGTDSIKPDFTLYFDNELVASGDIVSSSPEIKLLVKDNNPIPVPKANITLKYNYIPLSIGSDSVTYSSGSEPGTTVVTWKPKLKKGKHLLEVSLKDAAGNIFPDSSNQKYYFMVYENDDFINVYNYPNPFGNATAFCFDLRGTEKPGQITILVYTIAGRKIKQINVPGEGLKFDFNRINWNGQDEDGSEIGNGVYLYKLIAKYKNKSLSVFGKAAKIR